MVRFLWRNSVLGSGRFVNIDIQMPGGSPESSSGMAADKCIICPFIHIQAIELLQPQSPPLTRDLPS